MKPTPRQRLFTNEFKLGDKVGIIRTEHGWHDGDLCGTIVWIDPMFAHVEAEDGYTYTIYHPRDIINY